MFRCKKKKENIKRGPSFEKNSEVH